MTAPSGQINRTAGVFPYYPTRDAKRPQKRLSLAELVQLAQSPGVGPKAHAPLLTPYTAEAKTAEAARSAPFCALVVDHDDDAKDGAQIRAFYDSFDVAYLAWTTASHQRVKGGVVAPRWKVLIPFSRETPSDQFLPLAKGFALLAGADLAQVRPQQGFYAPRIVEAGTAYEWIDTTDTAPILDPLNSSEPLVKAALDAFAQESAREAAEQEPAQRMAEARIKPALPRASGQGSIIEKVNAAYDLGAILEAHGYRRCGDRYLAPQSSTGEPGVVVFERGGKQCLFSFHADTDPLSGLNHGGHSLDAFDVLTCLRFGGDQARALRELAQELDPQGRDQWTPPPPAYDDTGRGAAPGGETSQPSAKPFDLESARVGDMLTTRPAPRRWIVKDRLPLGVVALLAAGGGTGKSMATLQLAVSVCTGLPWLGLPIEETGSVVIFSAEDDRDEVHRRLYHIAEQWAEAVDDFRPHREAIAARMFVLDRVGEDNRLTATVASELRRTPFAQRVIDTVATLQDCRLIVLDPLSRFDGGEPNDSSDATRLIEVAEEIRKSTGATVWLPHHVNKNSLKDGAAAQEAVRGSSGLVDGSRWVGLMATMRAESARKYRVDPEEAARYVRFECVKGNYGPPVPGLWLKRQRGGVLVPVKVQEVSPAASNKEQQDADRYERFCTAVDELLTRKAEQGEWITERGMRHYAGTAGIFGMGDQSLRGCIKRALEDGVIVKRDPDGALLPADGVARWGGGVVGCPTPDMHPTPAEPSNGAG